MADSAMPLRSEELHPALAPSPSKNVARRREDFAIPRSAGAVRFGWGGIPCLFGLGVAAAATIVAFFGTGGLLLFGTRPVGPPMAAHSPVVAAQSPATQPSAAQPQASAALPAPAPTAPVRQNTGPAAPQKTAAITTAIVPREKPAPAPAAPTAEPAGIGVPHADNRSEHGPASAAGDAAPPPVAAHAAPARAPAMTEQPPAAATLLANPVRSETARSAAAHDATARIGQAESASLPPEEVHTLLTQGDAAFSRGDLTSARLLYRRAFEAGDGRGALGIGASYDPQFLRQFHLWTQLADPEEAQRWYLRARGLGVSGAEARLDRLKLRPSR
jgi:hypothetical protein